MSSRGIAEKTAPARLGLNGLCVSLRCWRNCARLLLGLSRERQGLCPRCADPLGLRRGIGRVIVRHRIGFLLEPWCTLCLSRLVSERGLHSPSPISGFARLSLPCELSELRSHVTLPGPAWHRLCDWRRRHGSGTWRRNEERASRFSNGWLRRLG